jgi:methylmalonyl-CoA/ethylmalonyl-CoA epimerase
MDKTGIGTLIVCQIGLVVKDIEVTLAAYCDIFAMAKPDIIITDDFEIARTVYRGESTRAKAKLAFLNMGQLQIELIEPIGEPSTWKEVLDEKGEGVHHIAFQIKGTDQVVQYLEGKECKMIQQGHYNGGMYTYIDSVKKLGVELELLENF